MEPRGHIGIGLILYSLLFIFFFNNIPSLVFLIGVGIVTLYSILPDIDVYDYWILSRLEHRGYTHSVFGYILIICSNILLMYVIGTNMIQFYIICISIGYWSHIVIDYMTPMGIGILYPIIPTRQTLSVFYSRNKYANNISILLGVGLLLTVYFAYFV